MSTLEKAFLKAMNVEDDQKSSINDLNPDEMVANKKNTESIGLNRLDINSEKLKSKEVHEIAHSRVGISRMKELEPFTSEKLTENGIIYASMTDKQLIDRYRNIRTKLLENTNKQNFITLVTSVMPFENSGMIAANLAATFSLDEAKTTMLIEADINNTTLNDIFSTETNSGLIDYLESDDSNCQDVLHHTGIPRLRFIPSGLHRENSAEYFTSSKMAEFIKELVERYPDRYPILNAPSVINSADTRILIELCDKVILVVPYGKCSDEEIMQAALAIGEKKLAGVILDGF